MTVIIYDNSGYAKGVEFPIDIPGYGHINSPADWNEYINLLEQEANRRYNQDPMKHLKIEKNFASTNPPTTE